MANDLTNDVMMYPNFLIRRPDSGMVLACTKTFNQAVRLKKQLDEEDKAFCLETFGDDDSMEFEIYEITTDKVVVTGKY